MEVFVMAEEIKVAVLGLGHRPKYIVGNLLKDSGGNVKIVAVFDPDMEVARETVKAWNIEEPFYAQDMESGQVIDIILKGTRWDFSDIYAVSTGEIRNNLWRVPLQKGDQISSKVGGQKDTVNALLETLDTWLVEHY